MAKSIDKVFDGIVKDCQAIAAEAIKNTAKEVQADIIKEAKSCLQKWFPNSKSFSVIYIMVN